MKKYRSYDLTEDHLKLYSEAALDNSSLLISEAKLLALHSHYARAYFLSVASIEETGKAYIAHEGKGRNLCDPGTSESIKNRLEDHPAKICSAFLPWIEKSSSKIKAIEIAVKLMVDLGFGREKSMYVDVVEGSNQISQPKNHIRPKAANDSIEVAANCLHHTREFILHNPSVKKKSNFEDKLFCIKTKTLTAMMSNADYWWFYISQLEAGNLAYEKIAVTYHDKYFKQKKLFKTQEKSHGGIRQIIKED